MDLLFANQSAASSLLLTNTAALNIVFKYASNLAVQSKEKKHALYTPIQKISRPATGRENILLSSLLLAKRKTQKNWR
jgi:hypothetical protein